MTLLNKDSNGLRKCCICKEKIPKNMKYWYTRYKSAYHGSYANVNLCAICIRKMAKAISDKELRLYKKQRLMNKIVEEI